MRVCRAMDFGVIAHQCLWNAASLIGLRNIGRFASTAASSYRDTVFYFDERQLPAVRGYVALTIDDGLCRQGIDCSMVNEVRQLLQRHAATATFFVCSKYLEDRAEATSLLADGHELANHCPEDREYASKSPPDFEADLVSTSTVLLDLIASVKSAAPLRWFRAPQAKLTASMREALGRHGLRHALGDCYCDDWKIPDPNYISRTLLGQVSSGSILVLHMPERGFREHTLEALSLTLDGLAAKGLVSVTLSKLAELAEGPPGNSS